MPAVQRYSGRLYESAGSSLGRLSANWQPLILSGGYGLVLPDEPIGQYDRRFALRDWDEMLIQRCLVAVADALGARRVLAFCSGSTGYAEAVRTARWGNRDVMLGTPIAAGRAGAQVLVPRAQGEALGALATGHLPLEWRSSDGVPIGWTRLARQTQNEAADLARRLGDPWRCLSPSDLAGHGLTDSAGLYAWWADEAGRAELGASLGYRIPSLVYIGQAGAGSSRSGRRSNATIRSRLARNHLEGTVGSSTLRLTLAAALLPEHVRVVRPGDEAWITAWMHAHLRLTIEPVADRGALKALEAAVLAMLDPPLNLQGMEATRLRTRLAALRSRFSAMSRSTLTVP